MNYPIIEMLLGEDLIYELDEQEGKHCVGHMADIVKLIMGLEYD